MADSVAADLSVNPFDIDVQKETLEGKIMINKTKLIIVAVSVVGAVAVLTQAVWADGKDTTTASTNVTTQVTAEEHAAHHPDTASANTNADNMMKMMGNGNMGEMMKMMGDVNMGDMMKMMQTPEGKALMEKCLKLLKQQSAATK